MSHGQSPQSVSTSKSGMSIAQLESPGRCRLMLWSLPKALFQSGTPWQQTGNACRCGETLCLHLGSPVCLPRALPIDC